MSTPAKTYSYSYLATADYTSRHIRNRLTSATVTASSVTTNLVTNTYDNYGDTGGCPARGPLVNRTDAREHDGAGYGSSFAFRGNASIVQTPGRTACLSHDILGRTTDASDAYSHSRQMTFANTNNYAAPTTITPNGTSTLASSFQYTPFLGMSGSTGPNTETISLTYDGQARPLTSTGVNGAQTTFAYFDSLRQRTATTNGRKVRTTYDGFGRVLKAERLDSGGTVRSIVDTEYAPCACSPIGKVKRVSMPYAVGGTVYWTTYTFDPLGRTLTTVMPNASGTVTYLYEGSTVKTTSPSAKWKKHENDAFGNLVRVTEQGPGGGADHVTDYSYTTLNQMKTSVMTRGAVTQTRTFNYDATTQRLSSTVC